ncbi:MAG: Asp-tRNA(Asn)/Glu-tRNA(Gln) amidotransferase subunit GatB [Spirochaetaceae bacterium]|nr:MAG: Asp-tRNA(Asn)/Glu-tRNA(Gln) amidotransferase subunit GatB [Spirochaetaceae bacterium]
MYQSFIGLEIHIQLLTETKVFCGCRAAFGDEPNSNVCPVCMGYPGVLPTLNQRAIHMAYLVARALNCTLAHKTGFERKNYFYPDLPKNYQISQFAAPLGTDGYIDVQFHRKKKRVRIHEVHLEEDAGKMIHAGDMSLLDYNRAGTPLLEIVTEPDMEIGEEAEMLLQQFRRLVRYLGVCDGNMEEGSMRCDANVSINLRGAGLGSKVEIKNMNSSRFVRKALNHEIGRQQEILERGGTVVQETRLWNENRDLTETMRVKESANDYRYFPEPDLPPFSAGEEFLAAVEADLVELPAQRKERFVREYALLEPQADFLCDEKSLADYYEQAVMQGADPAAAASWLATDVRKMLNRHGSSLTNGPLSVQRFANLLMLLAEGRIHGKIAKQTLEAVFSEDKDPEAIIMEKGWEQITDAAELQRYVDEVLADQSQAVEQINAGDSRPLGYLVGQIMRRTSGRAEPQLVTQLLKQRLGLEFVHVLSFGGAISGTREDDGLIVPGDLRDLRQILDQELSATLRFEEVQLGRFLSEEITPADWAALLDAVNARVRSGDASGIVIAHGTDTLAYTAGLLYWFFADATIPIVLTASAVPWEPVSERAHAGSEALRNLRAAVERATSNVPGVHVVYGDKDLSPINLKFERFGTESSELPGPFRNWNQTTPVYHGRPVIDGPLELDLPALTERLERAIGSIFVARIYPGMRGDSLIALINSGVKYFILELFDTGTASLRETPFSLKHAFAYGAERSVHFFCTSQQEGIVDFSEYVTSHELWKEGAIPMGTLTTETVYTRLIAALICSESEAEVVQRMEEEL